MKVCRKYLHKKTRPCYTSYLKKKWKIVEWRRPHWKP